METKNYTNLIVQYVNNPKLNEAKMPPELKRNPESKKALKRRIKKSRKIILDVLEFLKDTELREEYICKLKCKGILGLKDKKR